MTRADARIAVIGGLTLDHIVRSGRVATDVAGGNALYAALGARLYGAEVSLVSFVGPDYPTAVLDRLGDAGVDVSRVARTDEASIRLWILYDGDRRQIHYRHGSSDLAMIEQVTGASSLATSGWDGVHIGALPVRLQRPLLRRPWDDDTIVTLDSLEAQGDVGGDLPSYLDDDVLSGVTTFLPSEDEFAAIGGVGCVDRMRRAGLDHLVVKRGGLGVDVHDLARGTTVRVGPAPSGPIVDPTGAGDVFCGAFLAASVGGRDPVEAAIAGAAAASCVLDHVGGIHLLDIDDDELRRREQAVDVQTAPRSPS